MVLDIGANLGAFSVPIGRWLLERKGMIFAFEPQRVVYYQLCGNLFANGLRHVMARHCAVGDGSVSSIDVPQLDPQTDPNLGALSLDPNVLKWQRGSALGSGVESVPCIKLDDAGLPHAHLLKIDVEGMELEVLKGARSYIEASGWPVLMFEVWPESITPYAQKRKELLDFVAQELGYTSAHVGDLCIAQRPGFERIEIKVDGNRVDVRSKPA